MNFPLPAARAVQPPAPAFLQGGGETGALLRAMDWRASPLGPPGGWPPELRTLVGLMLASRQPMLIVWGPRQVALYNDGYAAMCGARHPAGLGRPFRELWHDVWEEVEPILARAYAGEATHMDHIAFTLHRKGVPEETHFAFGYTPVRDATGAVAGMFCACTEITERVRAGARAAEANAALRASEARWRGILDAAPVMIWLTDAEGQCTFLNRRWYEMTGQEEADALGLGWTRATHPDHQKLVGDAFLGAVARRESFRVEYRLRRADGEYVWAIDSGEPRFGPDGAYLGHVGAVFPIHELKTAEAALRETEGRLRLAIEAGGMGFWTLDTESGEMLWDARQYEIFGRDPSMGRLTFADALAAVHPADRPGLEARIAEALAGGGLFAHEFRVPQPDGSIRWVRGHGHAALGADGRRTVMSGLNFDVTAAREAEGALRLSEARFRAAVQAVNGIIWTTDAEGRMRGEQPGWAALTGQRFEEYQDQGWSAALHPEDRAPTLEAWEAALAACQPFVCEHRLRRHDGAWRRFAVRAIPAFGRDGRVREWVGVHTDVTETREAEAVLARDKAELEALVEERTAALLRAAEERRRAEEAARQAEKLAALGQLTGGVAHDFNNLLQVVTSGAALLRNEALPPARRARILEGMTQAGERARTLTGRLLAFARRQALRPERVDTAARLTGMAEMLAETLGRRIALETDMEPGLWPVRVDPSQLEVAILNLAVNARDAMPEGGRLVLQARNVTLAAKGERPAGDYVCIAVKDTGQGIPPHLLDRIFEPFFTTKALGTGTGLGLPQVHGFVTQSGGDIQVESRAGEGTAVFFHLPRDLGAPGGDRAPEAGAEVLQGMGLTVLVVEDNPDVAGFACSLLEGMGFATLSATHGTEALALLAEGARVDAVFSDVVMPGGISGVELAAVLRFSYPQVGVVLTTGYSEQLARGGAPDGVETLAKPYRPDEVAAALRAAMARARRRGG